MPFLAYDPVSGIELGHSSGFTGRQSRSRMVDAGLERGSVDGRSMGQVVGARIAAALQEIEAALSASRDVELTILMPCLNEAETLAACIVKAQSFLERTGTVGEILVADNGSTDGSREIARRLGARVVPIDARGYGAALAGGIAAARGRFVVMADSDDSYDLSRLDAFLQALRAGHDLVMGNRFKGGIATGAMPALHRYLGNPVLSFVGALFFRSPIGDFHCGLRGFRRDAIRSLGLRATGMEFASEMVVRATLAGLPIAEVPTTLEPDGRSRPPHLRSWRDGWRHLKLLLSFAPDWLFLYPGLALGGTGLLATLVLATGPVRLGPVELDSGTLVFANAAVLLGSQLVTYYLLATLHAVSTGMLPDGSRFARVRAALGVDRLCLAGGALTVLGVASAAAAAIRWVGHDFGPLDPGGIVRSASLSALAMALGLQTVMAGFLWGLLSEKNAGALVESADARPGTSEASAPARAAPDPLADAA